MQRRMITLTFALGIALMFVSSAAVAQYQLTNLVSNQTGQAKHTDPLLVNAWGLAYGPGRTVLDQRRRLRVVDSLYGSGCERRV